MNLDPYVCRVCLLSDSKGYALTQKTDLNMDYTYLDMFNACTRLEAVEVDGLPQFICQCCSHDLQMAFEFLYKASNSDEFLKSQHGFTEKVQDCYPFGESNKPQTVNKNEENSCDSEESAQFEHLDEIAICKFEDEDLPETNGSEPCKPASLDNVKDGFVLQFEHFVKGEFASKKLNMKYKKDPAHQEDTEEESNLETEKQQNEFKSLESQLKCRSKTSRVVKKTTDVEDNQYNQCKICGKFLKQMSLKYHLKRCQPQKNLHLCSSCPKSFNVRSDLKNHMKTHDTERERRYICSECGKGFFEKQSLKVHMSRHLGDKEYHCTICPKQFTTKKSLDVHEFTHNRELGRFVCKYCDKRFPSKSDLIVHERFHTGDYPFKCEFCDKSYAVKSHYNYHLAKHKGITYKCDKCDKEFMNRGSLTAHKFKHNERMPHECSICKKGFASPFKLNRHKSCHRPKEDDDRIK